MPSTNEEMLKKIDPLLYFEQFISEEVYPDGRDVMQFRPMSVDVAVDPSAYGSSYVQQSGASVSCCVKLSVAPNSDDPPLVYELKALECITKEMTEEANATLKQVVTAEYLLDADSLRIENVNNKFDLRFTLHLEIVAISADGFLTGAVLTAVQAALLNTRLPNVTYEGAAILESDDLQMDDIPLEFDIAKLHIKPSSINGKLVKMNDFLVHTSFLLHSNMNASKKSNSYQLLCDPTAELCAIIPARCYLMVGGSGGEEILALSLIGTDKITLNDSIVEEAFRTAQRRYAAISAAIERCQQL